MNDNDGRQVLARALREIKSLKNALEAHREPIAIVGAGLRLPGVDADIRTLDAYWSMLAAGSDVIREVPPERWPVEQTFATDPEAPGKMTTRFGAWLRNIDQFEPSFFGISPREAATLDPQQRLALETTFHAFEDAGFGLGELRGSSTGVYLGISTTDYATLLAQGDDGTRIDAYTATGTSFSVAAGRLSFVFGLMGPSLAVDTACSSSLVAVHLAAEALRRGECSLAVAGGTSAILHPVGHIFFSKARATSPDGRCKTFDARANGYVRGEGSGMLVLQRLSDARAQGRRIRAILRGSAINHGGPASGLTVPNGPAQEAVIRRALEVADLSPHALDWVEAHGTGTPLGDPIEARALGAVFQGRPNPLWLSSVKTNIGHLEASAGIAGLLKVLASLEHQQIPPHLHLTQPTPSVPWSELPLRIPNQLQPWTRGARPRRAGVSSFGFGGTNAHVVLEEPPLVASVSVADQAQVVLLSADSPESLKKQAEAWLAVQAPINAVARASVPRGQRRHRAAVVVKDSLELQQKLGSLIHGQTAPGLVVGERTSGPRKLVLVCGGQGGQWPGMGRGLANEPVFREAFSEIEAALAPYVTGLLSGPNALLFSESGEVDRVQPSIFALQVALGRLLATWGLLPSAVVGHSMGEVAAAHLAGLLSLADAAKVIGIRSRLLRQVAGQGGMMVVEADGATTERWLAPFEGALSIAAYNGERTTVVAGEEAALAKLLAQCEQDGVYARRIKVDVASHSRLMDSLLSPLEAALQGVGQSPQPTTPMLSTVHGEFVAPHSLTSNYWTRNLRQPVRFQDAIRRLLDQGLTHFVELGPHPVLLRAIEECLSPGARAYPTLLRELPERATLLELPAQLQVGGHSIEWNKISVPADPIDLPPYVFADATRCWAPHARARLPGESSFFESVQNSNSYPLLGQRLPSPLAPQFHRVISAQDPPFLADHAVFDRVIVPGASHVLTLLAAAREAQPGAALGLANVAFLAPLLLQDTPTTLCTTVEGAQVRLHSRQGGDFRLHAEAKAEPENFEKSSDLPTLVDSIDGADLYENLVRRGYQLGPSFARIRKLALGERQAVATLASDTSADYFHPGLLDSAFQTLGAAVPGGGGDATFVPVAIDRFDCRSVPGEGPHRAFARLTELLPDAQNPQLIRGDVTLFDRDGSPVAQALGLTAQKIEAAQLAGKDPLTGWFTQLVWQEAPAPQTKPAQVLWLSGPGSTEHLDHRDPLLFQRLQLQAPTHLVLVLGPGPAEPTAALERTQAVVDLANILISLHNPPKFCVVTQGAQSFPGPAAPALAGIPALLRSLALEHPALSPVNIDATDFVANETLLAEVTADSDEDWVVLHQQKRWVPRLHRASVSEAVPQFSPDERYLITGGLGGVGLAVAEAMIAAGARRLVLWSRRAPSAALADQLACLGPEIEVLSGPLSANNLPAGPIAGIVHAAGSLDDALWADLTPARLASVLEPKAGVQHLAPLQPHWWLFVSSAATIFGAPGQANYAAANGFMVGWASQLAAQGAKVAVADSGPWAQVGLAAQRARTRGALSFDGLGQLTPTLGAQGLLRILATTGRYGIFKPDAARLPQIPLLEAWRQKSATQDLKTDLLNIAPGPDRRRHLRDALRQTLAQVLRAAPERIADDAPLASMGLDSLMAVELRNRLEAQSGVRLSATVVYNYPTLAELGPHLADRMNIPLDPQTIAAPTVVAHQRDIAAMSDAEAEAALAATLAELEGA